MNMDLNLICTLGLFFAFFSSTIQATPIDVSTYGAKPDETKDCLSEALMKAWNETCASPNPGTIVIPAGTYFLNPITLQGPCQGPIEIQAKGATFRASTDPNAFKTPDWVVFYKVNCLTLTGGVFDGQGASLWGKVCDKSKLCNTLPINVRFNSVNNSIVQDITSKDSKQFNVNVEASSNITFTRYTVVTAPNSLNTDGIHIGRSTGINVTDATIASGDDCISIGDGSDHITISKVTCAPGHGISVGSLGKREDEKPVTGLTIKNCTFRNTENGVRIKTWPASNVCSVSELQVEDLVMDHVGTPICIDQEYCPRNQCNLKEPSKVKIEKVSFKNVRGTASTPVAVKLVCSSGVPCQNVELFDIDLTYTGPEGPAAVSQCTNVHPIVSGKQNPPACSSIAPAAPPK